MPEITPNSMRKTSIFFKTFSSGMSRNPVDYGFIFINSWFMILSFFIPWFISDDLMLCILCHLIIKGRISISKGNRGHVSTTQHLSPRSRSTAATPPAAPSPTPLRHPRWRSTQPPATTSPTPQSAPQLLPPVTPSATRWAIPPPSRCHSPFSWSSDP